jgi:glyoxylate/hydroxypyruvate/2-ketogluconate reductase
MKPSILVSRQLFPEVIARLQAVCEVDYHDADTTLPADELARRLVGKVGLVSTLTERIEAAVLQHALALKVVSNVAVGYNNIDLPACSAAGVMVTNTPGVLNETTADLVWALLMASGRRVVAADRWTRAGHWQGWQFHDPWQGQDIHGACLGILGMGRIGQAVARRAHGFDMRVIYHNRRPPGATTTTGPTVPPWASWVTQERLFAEADFLVVMVPYSAATHHLIGAAELAQMKPSAHLINVARGGVVDDAALIEALRERRIAGAGLDVFEGEPALNPGFFSLDNVTLTPHIGSSTRATRLAMAQCAADNLLAALGGQRPPNLLNPDPFSFV